MHLDHTSHPPAIFIETYGCQMNKYDSELIQSILEEAGYVFSTVPEKADVILINTCSVRAHAEERALGRISVLSSWKKASPKRKLGVVGCMAQRLGEALVQLKPYIDFVVGPDGYRDLPQIIRDANTRPIVHIPQNGEEVYQGIFPALDSGVCTWVTISRGCNNFCTYCIVPYTRGPERPRPYSEILKEVASKVQHGSREITLLGQNVNSYRDGEIDFPRLLQRVSEIDGLFRIRFLTSHPKDISDQLFEIMRSSPKICPHLHLPLQSGSNRILEKMNRKYTREQYLQIVQKARAQIPDLALTTDVLVGFPGETEADFEQTCALLEEIRFDDAFTYYFSPRKGTKAAEMKEQIPKPERLERLRRLIELQRRITLDAKCQWIGRTVEVLVERPSRRSSKEWMGRTPQNHVVVFSAEEAHPGDFLNVNIEAIQGTTFRGKVKEKNHYPIQMTMEENHGTF